MVIAIIAILAAILFPVFHQAKASAKQTVCMSNTRQLGMAAVMYMSDNDDGWFPTASHQPLDGFAPVQTWLGYDNNNAPLSGGWHGKVYEPAVNPPRPGALDQYIKSEGMKRCPSMPGEWQMSYAINFFNQNHPSQFYADHPELAGKEYGPSTKLLVTVDGAITTVPANNGEIEEPAQTLVAWEHFATVPACNFLQEYDWFIGPPHDESLMAHFHFLHRGGSNGLWADGHVKRLTYGGLKRPWFSTLKSIYNMPW